MNKKTFLRSMLVVIWCLNPVVDGGATDGGCGWISSNRLQTSPCDPLATCNGSLVCEEWQANDEIYCQRVVNDQLGCRPVWIQTSLVIIKIFRGSCKYDAATFCKCKDKIETEEFLMEIYDLKETYNCPPTNMAGIKQLYRKT